LGFRSIEDDEEKQKYADGRTPYRSRDRATLCLDLRHKYDSYINMQRRWTLAASLLQVSGKSLSCQHSAGEN